MVFSIPSSILSSLMSWFLKVPLGSQMKYWGHSVTQIYMLWCKGDNLNFGQSKWHTLKSIFRCSDETTGRRESYRLYLKLKDNLLWYIWKYLPWTSLDWWDLMIHFQIWGWATCISETWERNWTRRDFT